MSEVVVHLVVATAIVVLTLFAGWALRRYTERRAARGHIDAEVMTRLGECRTPIVVLVFVVTMRAYAAVVPSLPVLGTVLDVAMYVAVGWVGVSAIGVLIAIVAVRLGRRNGDDEQRMQRIRTQLSVFRTVGIAVVWLATLAFALLDFPATRPMATSLFASVSLLSLVVGIAAQRTLASLFAGLQIAFGDVVRIGDMVVIHDQRGTVEEITLTYVVLRLLDYRRMVVPVTMFTTEPFENWTRRSPGVKADIYVNVDPATPVAKVREWFGTRIAENPHWDGDEWSLSIVDQDPGMVMLRLHFEATAASPATAAQLLATMREDLQHWISTSLPEAIPRTRTTTVTN
ncbi:mechanosensitive ion channel family protein [Nocardia sp. NPDC056100]|uniref:mechanosensitive ion channel family protein n=1 Tax=Nocardia sp. NPDC056100 TaxID=3345712 RepID=UPI0035DDCD5F